MAEVPFEIRKRVRYAETMEELAQQVGDLARDVLRAGRESVALDGTNGALTGVLDVGAQDVVNAVTATYGDAPSVAAVLDEVPTLQVDWGQGQFQKVVLHQSATLVQFIDPPGVCRVVLFVEQGTASNTVAGWDTNVLWPGGTPPVITAAIDSRDKLVFDYDGENYWGTFSQDHLP